MELNEFRSYNNGIDDEYFDVFYFYFELLLNDADVAQPVIAKLQYAELNSEDWVDCPDLGESVLTSQFHGDDIIWSCEDLMFDILTLEIREPIGLLKKARIEVEYTLTDGSAGKVYSTELSDLFVYKGEYIREVSCSCIDGVITAVYQIDTDLVLDLSRLEPLQLTLSSYRVDEYYHYWNILDDAEITPFAEDGTFTVTCTVTDIVLDPDAINDLIIVYNYNDHDEFIYWDSFCGQQFEVIRTFEAPTLDSAGTEPSEYGYSFIPFSVTVADGTKYGDLTAYLQYWNGSDYELFENGNGPAAVNTVSLAQNSGDTTWQTGHSSAECLIADLEAEDGFGFFRVALKYTDDFGAEQFIYSDPMVVYKGTYVWPDDEVSQGVGDGYFYAYFRVDSDLVDLEKVATVEFTAKSPGGIDILNELEWFTLDTDSGEISVRGQVNEDIGEEFDHFIASVKLLYTDTEVGPVTVEWEGVSSTEVILDYWEEIAPEVITAGVQANESGTAFLVSFALLMNDVDVVNATLYCCESVDGTTYYECDPALGTTWLQHDNWGDYVSIWSTYPEGECLSYNFFIPEIMPGCFYWFYIEFECWMPSGSVSYVYTDPLPAYSGSFFELWTQYSSYAVYNPADRELRCTWGIYPNLAPELGSVTVDSVRLIPDSDEYSPIELSADCVTFIESDGSGPHFATVTVQDLALDNGPEWSLELTMSYSGGQYTWTSSGTAYVAWLNKALLKEHNSTTPPTGPAGGIS